MTQPAHPSANARTILHHLDPELVFAVVRPVGTSSDAFVTELTGKLLSYGYVAKHVKLSDLLSKRAGGSIEDTSEDVRIDALMDAGNELCREVKSGAAVTLLGIGSIQKMRQSQLNDTTGAGLANNTPNRRARRAYILDSVKRPEEIEILRQIYNDRVIVVGLQMSLPRRRERLVDTLTPQRVTTQTEIPGIVERLIERDLQEADEFGQGIRDAFPMADFFIDTTPEPDSTILVPESKSDEDVIGYQVGRLVSLLFDAPDYRAPTSEEFGMYLAQVSSTRSPELGLKVGAAIADRDGRMLGMGFNSHPLPKGSPAFDFSIVSIRDLVLDTLLKLGTDNLSSRTARRAKSQDEKLVGELLAGPLKDAKIRSLIEFQPTVHAEMAALHKALRCGVDLVEATVYVTAYPCHNCAKHLIALGLTVKYLEPYPKSKADAMYGQDVHRRFLPFTGVAPRLYESLFTSREDRKDASGAKITWSMTDRQGAQPKVDLTLEPEVIARRESAMLKLLENATPTPGVSDTATIPAASDHEEP